MTRSLTIIVVMGAVCSVGIIGLVVWTSSDRGASREQAREFIGQPRQFDTTGGQEMRPRWNSQEGESDGAADN